MSQHIFRVVVRGMFAELTDDRKSELLDTAPDHDIMVSAYTAAGTFTYDTRLVAFSFRYQIRVPGDDVGRDEAESVVVERGLELATAYLDDHDIGFKRLRANAVNMADMWEQTD